MANILAVITLISAAIYGVSMLNQTAPPSHSHSHSHKGGRRKTKKNRRK